MKNPRALVLPILALFVAGLVWFLQSGDTGTGVGANDLELELTDDGEAEIEVDKKADALEVVAEAAPDERVVAATVYTESASYRAALGGLRGRIVHEKDKEPIAGIEVIGIELRIDVVTPTIEQAFEFAAAPSPVKFRVRAKTDADGKFVLRGLHPRSLHVLGIGLKTQLSAVRFVDHTPQQGETVDMGDIVIRTRGALKGTVQTAAGKPVAGARVRALDIPAIAFQAGVGDFRPDGLAFAKFDSQAFVIPMPPWLEELDALLPFSETRTAADGSFRIEGVRPGAVTVLVQKDGEFPLFRSTRVKAEQERNVGTLRLQRSASITIRVVDTNDRAVPTARVTGGRYLAMTPVGLTDAPQRVGADGSLTLRGLPRGKIYAVWQRAPGARWRVEGPLRDGEEKTVVVAALQEAFVRVVDVKDEPVTEGVKLVVESVAASFLRQIPLPGLLPKVRADRIEPVPDDPGLFRIVGVTSGSWAVKARAPRYAIGAGSFEIPGVGAARTNTAKTPAKIVLVPGEVAEFEVVDERGQPVDGAHVYWEARRGMPKSYRGAKLSSPIPVALGKTDSKGRLATDGVPAGATRFAARHPAYAVAADEKTKLVKNQTLRIVLPASGSLEGAVTERGSRPKEPITLLVEPRINGPMEALVPPRFVRTDENGKFVIKGMQPGNWSLQQAPPLRDIATMNDFVKLMEMGPMGRRNRERLTITSGQVTRVNLELDVATDKLKYTGSYHLTVRLDGKPLEGALVSCYGAANARGKTDSAGRCSVDHLKDGQYYFSVSNGDEIPPMTIWSSQVVIKDGNRVDAVVDVFTGSAEVLVRDLSGAPLAGVAVTAAHTKGRGARANALTDADGRASLAGLPTGEYECRIQTRRDEREQVMVPPKTFSVVRGQQTRVELRAIKPATIEGVLRLDLSGLDSEQRQLAMEHRPRYGNFQREGGGRQRGWLNFGKWEAGETEKPIKKTVVMPGSYTLRLYGYANRDNLDWTSSEFQVSNVGIVNFQCVVKPNPAALKRILDKRAKAKATPTPVPAGGTRRVRR